MSSRDFLKELSGAVLLFSFLFSFQTFGQSADGGNLIAAGATVHSPKNVTLTKPMIQAVSEDTKMSGLGFVGGAKYNAVPIENLGSFIGQHLPDSIEEASSIRRQLTTIKDGVVSFGAPGNNGPTVAPVAGVCATVNVEEVLSRLSYSGHRFDPRGASCVEVNTDRMAADRNLTRYLNPASPEYLGSNIAGGQVDYNPAGYFITLDPRYNPTKQHMCVNPVLPPVEGIADSQTRLRNMISPRWQIYRRQDGTQDGLCVCQFGRAPGNFDGDAGVCTSNYFTNVVQTSAEVLGNLGVFTPSPVVTAAPTAVVSSPVVVTQTPNNQQPTVDDAQARILSCISDTHDSARNCSTLSSQARNRCKQVEEENSPLNTTGQLLGAGAQANTMMRAGTGAQGNCMRASALTMTARSTMEAFGESCSTEVDACQNQCKTTSYDDFIERCLTSNNTSVALLSAGANTSPEAVKFREKNESIRDLFTRASRTCNEELPRVESDTNKIVNGLGNTLQASMTCACQTSSAAGANCQAVPNINTCATNPTLAGCAVYGALNACVPGSASYDAKACGCLQNSSAPGCSGGTASPVSLFAGNLKATTPNGSSTFAGGTVAAGGAAARASNLNLNDGSNSETQSANLTEEGAKASGGPAVGNVGNYVGGAGGSGNGNIEDAAIATSSEDNVLGGLFNQVKNAVLNAVGKGSRGSNRNVASKNSETPDMKKFRPLRGLADTSNEVGSRNMDIWIMMNRCTRGESCKSNLDGFIVDP